MAQFKRETELETLYAIAVSSILKLSIVAVLVGGVIMLIRKGRELAEKVNVTVTGIANPRISNGKLTLQVNTRLTNPSPVEISIDAIAAKLYLLKSGMWAPVGNIPASGPVTFKPGDTDFPLTTVIDLQVLNPFGSNLVADIAKALTSGNSPLAQLRIDVTVTLKGFDITQSQTQTISINDLKAAA